MNQTISSLVERIAYLEKRTRQVQALAIGLFISLGILVFAPLMRAQPSSEPLRVKGLVIEDAQGRARIALGAPIPDDRRQANFRTGMRINDENGIERFGLTLFENGQMGMGFDAPRGKGDDRNRERINIVADAEGGAYIRFLDRRTSVAARLYLDAQNSVWMEFSDFMQKPPIRRRIGLQGGETIRNPQ